MAVKHKALHQDCNARRMAEMAKSVDEIISNINHNCKNSTLQRMIDRNINDIDYWLVTEGFRMAVFCEALNAAGFTRPGGQPMNDLYFGSLVSRARQRAARNILKDSSETKGGR